MIAIVDYGMGNLRSVQKALEIQDFDALITRDKDEIKNASHVILPGVGAIKDAMENLEKYDLIDLLKDQAKSGKPFLGICLGMQMMLSKSYENGEYSCLDIIKGEVVPFETEKIVPHMGWNNFSFEKKTPLFDGIDDNACVYFVHSYHASKVEDKNILTKTNYDYDFVSGICEGNIYGLQFHPEKSGYIGLKMLKNFGGIK